MSGKHIELFLVDGVAGGLTTAEIAGWTGHVLTCPRHDLDALLQRSEARRNGAYLLLGDDPSAVDGVRCYIGRTENFARRFPNHEATKEFWNRACLISSRDDAFNEGHWGYLESKLVDLARHANRSSLENTQTPQSRKLSEAQISDMEEFIHQLLIVLPVLGIHVFRDLSQPKTDAAPMVATSPIFTFALPRRKVDMRAQVVGSEFIVLEGSQAIASWHIISGVNDTTRRSYESYAAQHAKLVADGSIRIAGDHGVLTRDIAFTSSSGAGSVLAGRSCNGRQAWKWEGGCYADWEERGLHD